MNVTADLLRTLGTDRKAFDARCEQISALVQRNDKAACEAICRIYGRQTDDEKQVDATKHDNGIGFQQADAKFGGFIARLYRSGRMPYADRMVRVRRMAVKYRRQLTVLAFIKDMAKRMPPGSKSPIVIEMSLREGWPVKTITVDALPPNVCGYCNQVRCPDGCCCGC